MQSLGCSHSAVALTDTELGQEPLRVAIDISPHIFSSGIAYSYCYGFSYGNVVELLAEGGIEVDYVSVFRSVQRFVAWLIGAVRARRCQVVRASLDSSRSDGVGEGR
jgi:hypothetical protein